MSEEELVSRITAIERRLDGLVFPELKLTVGVAVYNSANIAIPTGVWTILTFNSERWDDAGFHSIVANTDRLTVPSGYEGWYATSGHVSWESSVAGSWKLIGIQVGTSHIAVTSARMTAAALTDKQSVSAVYYLSAGDIVRLSVYQNTGGNLNVTASAKYSPEFRMVRL